MQDVNVANATTTCRLDSSCINDNTATRAHLRARARRELRLKEKKKKTTFTNHDIRYVPNLHHRREIFNTKYKCYVEHSVLYFTD